MPNPLAPRFPRGQAEEGRRSRCSRQQFGRHPRGSNGYKTMGANSYLPSQTGRRKRPCPAGQVRRLMEKPIQRHLIVPVHMEIFSLSPHNLPDITANMRLLLYAEYAAAFRFDLGKRPAGIEEEIQSRQHTGNRWDAPLCFHPPGSYPAIATPVTSEYTIQSGKTAA